MKIVLLGPAWPFRGGIAAFNDKLSASLVQEGHEVLIYNFSLQYPSILFPGKTQFSDAQAPTDITSFRKINSINPFNWRRVGREINILKPDILLVHYWLPFMAPCFGAIANRVKKNKHAKVIGIVSNILPHERKFYDRYFATYFAKRMDGFITMASPVTETLKAFSKAKPVIQLFHPIYDHYGVPLSKADACKHLNLDPAIQYILFFGMVRKYKGLDILINALSDARIRKLNLKLIVAGEFYENTAEYKQQIERLGLTDRILVDDHYIQDTEVVNYFCAADMVVQPYRQATQSGVTQIAYHFNTPMLVTNVGGLPEMVADGKAGYVVEPDAEKIAAAIADFYEQNKKDVFTQNIKLEKKRFSWSVMVKGIMDLTHQISRQGLSSVSSE